MVIEMFKGACKANEGILQSDADGGVEVIARALEVWMLHLIENEDKVTRSMPHSFIGNLSLITLYTRNTSITCSNLMRSPCCMPA